MPYYKKSIYAIILFALLRLIVSCFIGLGNDESYYWTYAQQLQWNYFDHPPMVALWLKTFTLNLILDDYTLGVRLGSFIGCAIASYFIYKTIAAIDSAKAAYTGVVLYNASFYASITAGMMITPDTPQMVFFTASLYLMAKLATNDNNWGYWLAFGACAGLCIMSKVHGAFLWVGLGFYTLFFKRAWLLKGQLYVAALVTLLVLLPILIWNVENDFITYRFHSQRVTIGAAGIQWAGFGREMIGQLIVNNLLNVALIVACLVVPRLRPKITAPLQIYTWVALPLLAIIFFIALFRYTLPHWSGPAYVALIPMAAIGLARVRAKAYRRFMQVLLGYTVVFFSLLPILTQCYPGTFGSKDPVELGKGDISLEGYGWKEAGQAFMPIYQQQTAHIPAHKKPPLVCCTWWGAHVEYFFARPLHIKMMALGPVDRIHNYHWKNKSEWGNQSMDTAFCIVPSDGYYDVRKAYADYYNQIEHITTIPIQRGGKPAQQFYVYKLFGWKNNAN